MLPAIVAVGICGGLAILGAEMRVRWLQVVFKPLATILLLGVVGMPQTTFARLVAAGVALSVVGDVALLGASNGAFVVGLAAFLLAHAAYVIAFLSVGVWSMPVAAVAGAALVSTTLILRAIWPGAAGLRGPTVAYGVVISAMVVSASATVGGRLAAAPFAAVGAVLFYASDGSLALNRFRRPIPHAALLTFGVYWLGQIGIAIAARAGLR